MAAWRKLKARKHQKQNLNLYEAWLNGMYRCLFIRWLFQGQCNPYIEHFFVKSSYSVYSGDTMIQTVIHQNFNTSYNEHTFWRVQLSLFGLLIHLYLQQHIKKMLALNYHHCQDYFSLMQERNFHIISAALLKSPVVSSDKQWHGSRLCPIPLPSCLQNLQMSK